MAQRPVAADGTTLSESALIVGAGSGLSASLARLLSRQGMRVALAARDVAKLGALAQETAALALRCDATDAAQVDAAFAAVEKKWGVPDLVVYNASYRVREPITEVEAKEVERTLAISAFAGFLVGQAAAKRMLARAQPYPSKPVRVIVPFPPGGTTDLIARIVQPKFQEFIGNTVVIENRSGAGGSVGALEAAQAAPDGYTLLMVFDTHAVNHHIFKMAPDPFKAFEHIMLLVTSPSLLVGVSNFAPNTRAELVARAKAQPERVTYATPGSGSSNHPGALLF